MHSSRSAHRRMRLQCPKVALKCLALISLMSCRRDRRRGRGSHFAGAAGQVPAGREPASSRTMSITTPRTRFATISCGGRSYSGHDGTDIRIRNLEVQRQGVEVLAAAPGRVIGGAKRHGRHFGQDRGKGRDRAARNAATACCIEHEGGWRTQYCHMAKGQRPGQSPAIR